MSVGVSELFGALSALGAGEFSHLNGSLERHLVAVHDLLQSWGADDTLRHAGLYHAAYGTAGFTTAMVSPTQRMKIASLIGSDAEQIVYRYCSCDRSLVWPQIGTPESVQFRDRFTNILDVIDGRELTAFCELTCANELEIANNDPGFIERAGSYLGCLFKGWHLLLSEPAQRAVESAFPSS